MQNVKNKKKGRERRTAVKMHTAISERRRRRNVAGA